MQDVDMIRYYARRAGEYETIYHRDDETRQREQRALEHAMNATLWGRSVLEVACGTGYWTERLAAHTTRMVAVDASLETLELARAKSLPVSKVAFRVGDAFRLEASVQPGERFGGGLANFWLSHVPKTQVQAFLQGFHARLEVGARVFMADNVFYGAATSGRPIARADDDGLARTAETDGFVERHLQDGSRYEILKNYLDRADLERIFAPVADDLEVHVGSCFWWVSYTVRGKAKGG